MLLEVAAYQSSRTSCLFWHVPHSSSSSSSSDGSLEDEKHLSVLFTCCVNTHAAAWEGPTTEHFSFYLVWYTFSVRFAATKGRESHVREQKALDENVTGSSETFLSISSCSLSSKIMLHEVMCGQLIDFLSEKWKWDVCGVKGQHRELEKALGFSSIPAKPSIPT